MTHHRYLILIVAAALGACRSSAVVKSTQNGEIEYLFNAGSCSVRSLHREGTTDLRLRSDCTQEAPYLEGLRELAGAWRDDGIEVRTLFVGRIDEQVIHGGPLGLSRKAARLSAADAEWDSRGGRAKSGNSNAWMEKALRDPALLAPYREALKDAGYPIMGASVEKVRYQEAAEDAVLVGEGLKGRLAWDALLYLKVGYNP